jgi:hypothetical protein
MYLRKFQLPTPRDFEIYYAHVSDDVSQKDLAEKYHISAPRISQIVAKAKRWLANGLPRQRASQSPEQDAVVALCTRMYEAKKCLAVAVAMREQQTKPPPDGAKPTRPDPRWNKQADDLAEVKCQIELRLSTACHAVQAKQMTDSARREDQLVAEAIEDAEDLCGVARDMMREELIEPFVLPKVDKRAIEIAARNSVRAQHPNRTLQTHAALLPEWQAVSNRVFNAPLGGLCAHGVEEAKSAENGPKTGRKRRFRRVRQGLMWRPGSGVFRGR